MKKIETPHKGTREVISQKKKGYENPLDDFSNVSKIACVMVNGMWFSRADLDEMLEKL